MNFGGSTYQFAKEDFGVVIVMMDFIVIVMYLYFVMFIDSSQKEFIKEFKDQSIEMDDFAVEVSPLPKNSFFGGNEHVLRAHLWLWAENLLNDQYQRNAMNDQVNLNPRAFPHLTIADINFSNKNNQKIESLKKIGNIRKQLNSLKKERKIKENKHVKLDKMMKL